MLRLGFGLIPMMLLHRPRGTGSVGREELARRADGFAHGRFSLLLRGASHAVESQRYTRDAADTIERRGRAAQSRVEAGQVSRARQELVGASLAPKTQATFDELQGKRPQQQMRQIPPAVLAFVPEHPLQLDFSLFTKCLQNAKSGRSPGPGECSNEMWRVCLDDYEVFQLLFRAAEDFARADIPDGTRVAFMSVTMTALQKLDGRVRRIATVARQFSKQVEATCAPFQFALSKLHDVPCLRGLLPFVRATYAQPTEYLWEDAAGCDTRSDKLKEENRETH